MAKLKKISVASREAPSGSQAIRVEREKNSPRRRNGLAE